MNRYGNLDTLDLNINNQSKKGYEMKETAENNSEATRIGWVIGNKKRTLSIKSQTLLTEEELAAILEYAETYCGGYRDYKHGEAGPKGLGYNIAHGYVIENMPEEDIDGITETGDFGEWARSLLADKCAVKQI